MLTRSSKSISVIHCNYRNTDLSKYSLLFNGVQFISSTQTLFPFPHFIWRKFCKFNLLCNKTKPHTREPMWSPSGQKLILPPQFGGKRKSNEHLSLYFNQHFTKSLHHSGPLFPSYAYRSERLLDSTKIQFLNGEVIIFGFS